MTRLDLYPFRFEYFLKYYSKFNVNTSFVRAFPDFGSVALLSHKTHTIKIQSNYEVLRGTQPWHVRCEISHTGSHLREKVGFRSKVQLLAETYTIMFIFLTRSASKLNIEPAVKSPDENKPKLHTRTQELHWMHFYAMTFFSVCICEICIFVDT